MGNRITEAGSSLLYIPTVQISPTIPSFPDDPLFSLEEGEFLVETVDGQPNSQPEKIKHTVIYKHSSKRRLVLLTEDKISDRRSGVIFSLRILESKNRHVMPISEICTKEFFTLAVSGGVASVAKRRNELALQGINV